MKIKDVPNQSFVTVITFCITLRYLAIGDAQVIIASNSQVSSAIVTRIMRETCDAVWNELMKKDILKVTTCEEQWKKVLT